MVVIRPVLFCQWCLLSLFALSKLQLAHAQTVKALVKDIDRKKLILVSEKKDRKGNHLLHVLKVYLINLPNSHQPTQASTHSDIILSTGQFFTVTLAGTIIHLMHLPSSSTGDMYLFKHILYFYHLKLYLKYAAFFLNICKQNNVGETRRC